MSTLNLVKARFSKDARISRLKFNERLSRQFGGDLAGNLMPAERNLSDALRWGINHALRPYQKFYNTDSGEECKVIVASTKGKEFDVAVHVQSRGQEVNYSRCVCQIKIITNGDTKEKYPLLGV